MSSVSAVYEDPSGSPPHCVKVRYDDHVATHRFYDEGVAQDFREQILRGTLDTALEDALERADLFLEGRHTDDERPTAVHHLAHLTTVVRNRLRELGRA